jgi:ComEC/Rec2-related protein
VPTLVFALAFATGTALGAAVGSTAGAPPLLVAAGVLAVLAWRLRAGGRFRATLVAAAFGLCGLARGGFRPPPEPLPAGEGLVRAEVVGASTPAGTRCLVQVRPVGSAERWALQVDPARCPRSEGQQVWVRAGDLSDADGPRWPGDTERAPRDGADRSFVVDHLWPASPPAGGYWAAVAALRHAGEAAARGDPGRGFVVAAVLGLPAALPPDERAGLRHAGLGHLVAVSGMNVAVAAVLLRAPLLRLGLWLGGGLALGCALAWLPVAAYVGLTGAAAPAVRAAAMLTLGHLAVLCGRPGHGTTTLALAAAGLLAWRPGWALDPGFQLSVAAMAVLVRPGAPTGLLAQSWQVTWATCPIGLAHFGDAAVWGVAANLVAVPVFTLWILPVGAIGCALWPWLGPDALAPAAVGGRLVLDVAGVFAGLPAVPAAGLAAAAAGCAALRWLRVRGAAALPGPWVCAAVIAAALATRRVPAEAEPPAWFAVGGARAPAIVVPAEGRRACVHDPGLRPEAWPRLLAALGYASVAALSASRGEDPPHVAALREQLARAGLWRPAAVACPLPPREAVRRAMRACRERTGQAVVAVRDGPACFVDGAWAALE